MHGVKDEAATQEETLTQEIVPAHVTHGSQRVEGGEGLAAPRGATRDKSKPVVVFARTIQDSDTRVESSLKNI